MQRCLAALLCSAAALAQVPDNTVWATDFSGTTRFVTKIDPRGEVITSLATAPFTPFGLAVDQFGNCWAGSNGNSVAQIDPTGTVINTFPVGSFPQSVAFDQAGFLWVVNRGSNTVMKLDQAGAQVLTVPLPAGTSPIGVVVDVLGQVWVSGFHASTSTVHTLTVLDQLGTVLNTFNFTAATPGFGFSFPAADITGNIWVANQAQSALLQVDQFGQVVTTTPITTGLPRGCAVDGTGHVWLANQGFAGNCMKIDRAGTVVATFLPPSTSFTTVSIDGNGDPWVFGFSSGKAIKLWQVDATPLVEVAVPSGGSAWGGDTAAFHLARVLQPNADFDGDGYLNNIEITNGTNPFNARSTPAQPQLIQSGIPNLGATVHLGIRLRAEANRGYMIGISAGNGPTVLPDARLLPLSVPLELLTIGLLDGGGDARLSLTIPGNPGLSNQTFYFAYVTLDPASPLGIRTISNDLPITIR